MTFRQRLTALGFRSYRDYLASEVWAEFKRRYVASGRPRTCAVCDKTPVQLHHHTYDRLGAEDPTDVTPLCRGHHRAVHEWLTARRTRVTGTSAAVADLKQRLRPKRSEKRRARRKESPGAARARELLVQYGFDEAMEQLMIRAGRFGPQPGFTEKVRSLYAARRYFALHKAVERFERKARKLRLHRLY